MRTLRSVLLASAMAVGFAGAAAPAHAGIVNGSDFTSGLSSQIIDGITWTANPGGRTFQQKFSGGFFGVGISDGATSNEIDIDEFLNGSWTTPRTVTSFTVGVLYDGPEFSDFQEVAQVTFTFADMTTAVYTLTNFFDNNTSVPPVWTGPGTVTQLSDDESSDVNNDGAVWRVEDINLANVVGVSFTALPGTCGTQSCASQSDYTLVQFVTVVPDVTLVPEPATLALLGAGLLGLGFAARRRQAA